MKITNQSLVEQNQYVVSNTIKKSDEVVKKEAVAKDKITVSAEAKEINALKSEVMKMPDINIDKVNQIRQAYLTGSYNVKGEAIAQKIIKEAIIDSIV